MKILSIGTCRTHVPLCQKYLENTYTSLYDITGGTFSTKDTIQLINWINNEKEINPDFYSYCFIGVTINEVLKEKYKKALKEAEIIFVELSSYKYALFGDVFINNMTFTFPTFHFIPFLNDNSTKGELSYEELENEMAKLVTMLSPTKVIFVTHINFPVVDDRLEKRTQLIQNIENICNKRQYICINPTKCLTNRGHDMCKMVLSDGLRYTEEGCKQIADVFASYIDKYDCTSG